MACLARFDLACQTRLWLCELVLTTSFLIPPLRSWMPAINQLQRNRARLIRGQVDDSLGCSCDTKPENCQLSLVNKWWGDNYSFKLCTLRALDSKPGSWPSSFGNPSRSQLFRWWSRLYSGSLDMMHDAWLTISSATTQHSHCNLTPRKLLTISISNSVCYSSTKRCFKCFGQEWGHKCIAVIKSLFITAVYAVPTENFIFFHRQHITYSLRCLNCAICQSVEVQWGHDR